MHLRTIIERLAHKTHPGSWYSKYELSNLARCKRASISPALSQLRRSNYTILMRWDHHFHIWEYNIHPQH